MSFFNMKKTLITLIIIILIALGGVLGFFYFSGDSFAPTEEEGGLFPEGESGNFEERGSFGDFFMDQDGDGTADAIESGALLKLSDQPVAGSVIFEKQVSTSTAETYVRYVGRGTGHIFEAKAPSTAFNRISNTTIPKTRSAVWSPTGNVVLLQYEEESDPDSLRNFLANISDDQREGIDPRGSFLPNNINSPQFSPSGEHLAYISDSEQGSNIVIYEVDSGNSSIVYSSTIREWSVSWADSSTLVLNTKPSGSTPGFAYTIPMVGGELSKLVGGFRGLMTTLSPDREDLVITVSSDRGFHSFLRDQGENIPMSANIIPDKCVWSNSNSLFCGVPSTVESGVYPDAWYQGRASFSDIFWRLDPGSGQSDLVRIPEEITDAINLSVSEDESYLIFENKKDHSLWLLTLSSVVL